MDIGHLHQREIIVKLHKDYVDMACITIHEIKCMMSEFSLAGGLLHFDA